VALYRAQLAELDRDLAEGRIAEAEFKSARLEVQRHLLAASVLPEEAQLIGLRTPLILAAILVPLVGEALYLIDGHPELPSANALPKADALAQADEAERLISTLREKLADLDPKTPLAAQGYLLLGNAEANRGNLAGAVKAWSIALEVGFQPALAAQTAEGMYQMGGKITPQIRDLFTRALAESPPDAPWRGLVQQRLSGGDR
jgi:cytochrome c-type biogenesis protein CcmH